MQNYKLIVTLKSGAHRIVRVTRDVVAHIVSKFREMQASIFNDAVTLVVSGQSLTLNDIKEMLFINEWTGERLEIS